MFKPFLILVALSSTVPGCSRTRDTASMPTAAELPLQPRGLSARTWYQRVEPLSDQQWAERHDPAKGTGWLAGDQPVTREAALKVLLSTRSFGDGFIDALSSERVLEGRALAQLLEQPDSMGALRDLIRRGQPAGQLYGLVGLRLTEPATFARELQPFLERRDELDVQVGCETMRLPIARVADEIRLGRWAESFAKLHVAFVRD